MKILGTDLGFSEKKDTSAYCILSVKEGVITLDHEPTKYIFKQYSDIFTSEFLDNIDIVTIDAPITYKRHLEKPKTGRIVDKLFSGDIFNNSKRGPQPGSISTPMQGWPLYLVGMEMREYLEQNGFKYPNISEINKNMKKVAFEIIPKLTQSFLVDREILISRGKKDNIDNYLLKYTFEHGSRFRKCFGDYEFDENLEYVIEFYLLNPKKYHEELAALLAGLQGVLYAISDYSIIGGVDDYEGFFLLPKRSNWAPEWNDAFEKRLKKYDVIEKS